MDSVNSESGHAHYDETLGIGVSLGAELSDQFDDSTSAGVSNVRSPSIKIELLILDGLAAEALLMRQATVVYEALQWFAANPLERDSHDSS